MDLLTISTNNQLKPSNKIAAEHAAKFMRRTGIEAKNLFEDGQPSEKIIEVAGNNNIIIMGASTKSPIKKFFKGSKPLDVIENCNCPILIVK